jgi:hypothetical protein
MSEFDPYAEINTKLDHALAGNDRLAALVLSYSDALKHRDTSALDRIGAEFDTAMKDAGLEYLDRIQAKRMLQNDASAAREDGIKRTLVKQVHERHEGR